MKINWEDNYKNIEKKEVKTCSQCGFAFYDYHECDPEVLRDKWEQEARYKEELIKKG